MFAGLSATVQSIALPASVVLAGVLIDAFDSYRVVFGLLALMSLLALGVCVWLRQAPRAPVLA